MIGSSKFIPTKEDMHKLIKAFASVHVDGALDDIGPNKPDAPFFVKMAEADEVDEEDYIEMTDRFHKYTRTQLPLIQHIAGYPPETDWSQALILLKEVGMKAREEKDKAAVILAEFRRQRNVIEAKFRAMFKKLYINANPIFDEKYGKTLPDGDASLIWNSLEELGMDKAEAMALVIEWLNKYTRMIVSDNNSKVVKIEEYEEVWFSRNDPSQRYPRKSKRLALDWGSRNRGLYNRLKNSISFPSFKWDGTRMSISIDERVIQDAIVILQDEGYYTQNIDAYLETLKKSAPVTTNSSGYSATLKADAIMLKVPYDDTDSRYVIKQVNGRKWQPDDKAWSVPISEASSLIKKLTNFVANTEQGDEKCASLLTEINKIEKVKTYLLGKAERIAISDATALHDDELVDDMKERLAVMFPAGHELYPFQYAGVRFAELAEGRALIGDDMGVGKTIQAIAYAALHQEYWPVLVVTPANVKYNWGREISTWLPKSTLQVVKNGKVDLEGCDFTVINYDLVAKQQDNLHALDANLIIFDESHYLKNKGTTSKPIKRTVACVELAEHVESVLCLSGTPITNRPIELFTTLEMIKPAEYKGNFFPYAKRYCDAHNNGWGWDFTGSSNVEELHEKLRDTMIRRMKKDVLDELPDKIRQFIPIVPSTKYLADYRRMARQWLSEYDYYKTTGGMPAGFVLNMLTALRHAAGQMKVPAAANWIAEYQDQNTDKPIIVFHHHRDVGEELVKLLRTDKRFQGKKWGTINGSVSAEKRFARVEAFQAGELDGLICSTIAAKEGLTLTEADTVVFIEREWVSGWEEQAEDRVNRIGQDADLVHAVYLSVVGTIDEKFDRIVEEKREVVSAILDGTTHEEGTKSGVAKALLQAMVDAGDIPAGMMNDIGVAKPKTHTGEDEE
ncbi:MAG: hypothetical protein CXT67_00290 [Methanobacteriota archaeon]|nr:MAG: hypothetical protein CXT67_00290 [Euryarchaeota archaeon]